MEDPAGIEALIQKAQVFMRKTGGPADFACTLGDDLARAAALALGGRRSDLLAQQQSGAYA
jgi:hypothetical protein